MLTNSGTLWNIPTVTEEPQPSPGLAQPACPSGTGLPALWGSGPFPPSVLCSLPTRCQEWGGSLHIPLLATGSHQGEERTARTRQAGPAPLGKAVTSPGACQPQKSFRRQSGLCKPLRASYCPLRLRARGRDGNEAPTRRHEGAEWPSRASTHGPRTPRTQGNAGRGPGLGA